MLGKHIMTPENITHLLLAGLILMFFILLAAGIKHSYSTLSWNKKRTRWDYAWDGRIILVDMQGELVAIARGPKDADLDRLRWIAIHWGYYPPTYDVTPINLIPLDNSPEQE